MPTKTTTSPCTSMQELGAVLRKALSSVPAFEQCALLDFPDHLNAGDHFIWVAAVLYLEQVHGTRIKYTASLVDFDGQAMERAIGSSPIFFQGGGNLGDLWPDSQLFREKVIARYHDRPIVILPQSVQFKDAANLERAASIFNAHPDLTIFIRDTASLAIAEKHFSKCKLHLAPDMVAHLSSIEQPFFNMRRKKGALYLSRNDSELHDQFGPRLLPDEKIVVADWPTYSWAYDGRGKLKEYKEWYWQVPNSVTYYREFWQRGLKQPAELFSRLSWLLQYKNIERSLDRADRWKFSMAILHDSFCFLNQFNLVITNRLHGHILSQILDIPNILVPNSYHKNSAFFQTWQSNLTDCRFVDDPAMIQPAFQALTKAPR